MQPSQPSHQPSHPSSTNHPHGDGHSSGIGHTLGNLLHVVSDTIAGAHVAGAHLPKSIDALGKVSGVASEVLHNPNQSTVKTAICNGGVLIGREAMNATAALAAGMAAGGLVSPATGPSAVAVGAATAVVTYKTLDKRSDPVAKLITKACHTTLNYLFPPPKPPAPPKERRVECWPSYDKAAANRNFGARNPSFGRSAAVFPQHFPWTNRINRIHQEPSLADIYSRTMQAIASCRSSSQSIMSAYQSVNSSLGGQVSYGAFQTALSSCHGYTQHNGMIYSNSAIEGVKMQAFSSLLAATGLSTSYNSYNGDAAINMLLASLGFIGGVAHSVAFLEGDSCKLYKEHIIAIKGGETLPPELIERLSYELYVGIFHYNSYPFFSLHFNEKGVLYPVLHPCYEHSLVGRIIGFLDDLMKGYLNGAIFSKEFLEQWHHTANMDRGYLKSHLIDIKILLKEYHSLREMTTLMGLDGLEKGGERFRTSFRIIAKQNSISAHENLFLIDPDVDVEYTVDLLPDYKESLERHREKHGRYPDDHMALLALYHTFAEKIRKELKELPQAKEYFHLLGVMNFLCYYYHTLKVHGKEPVVQQVAPLALPFPKALPPLPVRYYQKHPIRITLQGLLKGVEKVKGELDRHLYETFWLEEGKLTPALETAIYTTIYGLISQQIGQPNLEESKVKKLADHLLNMLEDITNSVGDLLLTSALKSCNNSFSQSFAAEPALVAALQLNEEKFTLQETPEEKLNYLYSGLKSSIGRLKQERKNSLEKELQTVLAGLPAKIDRELAELSEEFKKEEEEELKALQLQVDAIKKKVQEELKQEELDLPGHVAGKIAEITLMIQTQVNQNIQTEIAKIPVQQRGIHAVQAQIQNFTNQVRANEATRIATMRQDMMTQQQSILEEYRKSATTRLQSIETGHKEAIVAIKKERERRELAAKAKRGEVIALNSTKVREGHAKMAKECDEEVDRFHQQLELSIKTMEGNLKGMSDWILQNNGLAEEALLDQTYLHSVVDFLSTSQDKLDIWGGCGMRLDPITPTHIHEGASLVQAASRSSSTRSTSFNHKEESYQAFKMGTRPLSSVTVMKDPAVEEKQLMETQGYNLLMVKTLEGDVEGVQKLLTSPDVKDHILPSGMDALFLAIQLCHEEIALSILVSNKGYSLNRVLDNGMSHLHLSLELRLPAVAKKLIEMGADLTLRRKKDDYTALHLAAATGMNELIALMVTRGASINAPLPSSRKTPLHIAVDHGRDVKPLLALGVDCSIQDLQGNTALHLAIKRGETEIALLLAEKTPISLKNKEDETAVHLASRYEMFSVAYKRIALKEEAHPFTLDRRGGHYPYYIVKGGVYESSLLSKIPVAKEKYGNKSLLAIAAEHGHGHIVELLLQHNVPYSSSHSDLISCMVAIDDVPHLKSYLKKNSPPENLFHIASEHGSSRCMKLLLNYLPIHRAKINAILLSAIKGGDPLLFSLLWQEGEKKALIKQESPLDEKGNRILHLAVDYGRIEIVQKLLQFGHSPESKNGEGKNSYDIALDHDDRDILALLKKVDGSPALSKLAKKKEETTTALREEAPKALVHNIHKALRASQFRRFTSLISSLSPNLLFDGRPLLHLLLELDKPSQRHFTKRCIQYLAAKRVDPLLKDKEGDPLSFILLSCTEVEGVKKKLELLQSTFLGSYGAILAQTNGKGIDVAEKAMEQGAIFFLEALSKKPSENALKNGAMAGEATAVLELLRLGMKGNLYDEKGYTPLLYAAKYGHEAVVEAFVSHGVNPNLADREGNLPLHLAIRGGHIESAHHLISAMHEIDKANRQGLTPLMVAAAKNLPSLITRLSSHSYLYNVDERGWNCLHIASFFGSKEAVEKLLALGMDIHVGSSSSKKGGKGGLTPLYFAALGGHLELFRLLLTKGAQLNRVGHDGTTILDGIVESNNELMYQELVSLPQFYERDYQRSLPKTAALHGNLPVMRELYLLGVPLDQYDKEGLAPLHYAVIAEKRSIVTFLLKCGVNGAMATATSPPQTALELAKDEGMKELIRSNLLMQEFPLPPSPLSPRESASPQVPGNSPPINVKEGLTKAEADFIQRKVAWSATPAFFALAARVKRELGQSCLHLMMAGEPNKEQLSLLTRVMTLALLVADPEAVKAACQSATLEKMEQGLESLCQASKAKFPKERPSHVLKAIFRQKNSLVEYPLSEKECDLIATQYDRVLELGKELFKKSDEELALDGRKEKDPLALVAIVREVLIRKMKISPYDTQLFALLALIQPVNSCRGRIGQIQTGEGKSTLIAMMGAFYGLQGKMVDIITTSDSLAKRDEAKYRPFYKALHLLSSHICVPHPDQSHFHANIIYGTNSDFEFALLREQLSDDHGRYGFGSSRTMDVAIIDEVDSLFLDLGLSSARIAESSSYLDYSPIYSPYLEWIRSHERYDVEEVVHALYGWTPYHLALHNGDEMRVKELLAQGVPIVRDAKGRLPHDLPPSDYLEKREGYERARELLQNKEPRTPLPETKEEELPLLSSEELRRLYHVGRKALLRKEYTDYVVDQGEIVIVDHRNTGRLHRGCRWGGGMHEFIEAKHKLPIKPSSSTAASVSHVAFFRMYTTLIGLSGTIGEETERQEIERLYQVTLFDAPPHFPSQRITFPPALCEDEKNHEQAIIKSIQDRLKEGRSVLLLLQTIEDSKRMALRLKDHLIDHHLLNAVQPEEEEYILVKAGESKAVTVATNTAGRGTDIILSQENRENGGLHVILSFYPANIRVEKQGMARGARQGQKGSCEMILHRGCSSIQSLIPLRGLEKLITFEALAQLRKEQVEQLSHMRLEEAQYSIMIYEMFMKFCKMRRNLDKALEADPLAKSLYQEAISALWSHFYEGVESSRLDKEQLMDRYHQFLECTLKPLFKAPHDRLQKLIIFESSVV